MTSKPWMGGLMIDEALERKLLASIGRIYHADTCGQAPKPSGECSCGFSSALRRACRELEEEAR